MAHFMILVRSPEWNRTCLVEEWAFAETILKHFECFRLLLRKTRLSHLNSTEVLSQKSDEVSGSKGGNHKFHDVWKSKFSWGMKMFWKYELAVWWSIQNIYSHFTKVTRKCKCFSRIVEPCTELYLSCDNKKILKGAEVDIFGTFSFHHRSYFSF
jgi:hypothetical protein